MEVSLYILLYLIFTRYATANQLPRIVYPLSSGYDTMADFEMMYMFCNIKYFDEPAAETFQRAYNAGSRRVRMFLDTSDALKEHVEHFDMLTENPDVVAACNWIFDLLNGKPEALEKIARTDIFNGDPNGSCDASDVKERPKRVTVPSYMTQLRVFYELVSREIYLELR